MKKTDKNISGGVVPGTKTLDDNIKTVISNEYYVSKDQYFSLMKSLGQTDEHLEKEWDKLTSVDFSDD